MSSSHTAVPTDPTALPADLRPTHTWVSGHIALSDLAEPAPRPGPGDWNPEGVAAHRSLIPEPLIAAYEVEWRAANGFDHVDDGGVLHAERPGGYGDVAYLHYPALFDLVTCAPLAAALEALLGEPAGVHLCLSGWVSTERDWHQDSYLNPAHVGDAYAAVWIALGSVSPWSGPFQWVPGSHRWHRLTREKIGTIVDLADPAWPKHTETVLSPLVEAEIRYQGGTVVTHLPDRGDALVWHPRLYHRGSAPATPGAYRPGLIAHFSGIRTRRDFPHPAKQAPGGGWYYPGLG